MSSACSRTTHKIVLLTNFNKYFYNCKSVRVPVSHAGGDEIFRTRPDLPWAHPASYTMGTGSFPAVKRPGLGVNHLPPSSKGKGVPRQAEVAQGVPGRLRPRIILTFRHYKGRRSSAKRTGRLYPKRNPCYSLSEAESTSGHMVLSGVPRKKIHSDTTGNRSRDRPTSGAAP